MSNISDLSSVWQEYLRTVKYNRSTRIVGHIIYYDKSGIEVDLLTLKQNIKITDARKLIHHDYNRQRVHGDYQYGKKFRERERQKRVEGFSVKQLQSLTGSRFIQAVTRITTGRAVLAGLG